MSSYRDFRRRSLKRRARHKIVVGATIAISVLVVGGLGWFGVSKLPFFSSSSSSSSVSQSTSEDKDSVTVQPTAQPLEIHNQTSIATPNETNANWNTKDYEIRVLSEVIKTEEDGTTAMDYRLAGLPEQGYADLSYFDSVAFLGDSISQGWQVYDTPISNVGATFCAYIGATPKTIVDMTLSKNAKGEEEIPLDVLTESAPEQIYILLGTNTLVSNSDYSSYLAYYEKLIQMVYERLPDVTIYVQSITPVQPSVRNEKPGLYTARLMEINNELAALALRNDCYFLNLWEVFADENGNLIDTYAAGDGLHLNPSGYRAWVEYLRTHTAYTPSASYAVGTSYKID